jgi:SulP family sulfate permease
MCGRLPVLRTSRLTRVHPRLIDALRAAGRDRLGKDIGAGLTAGIGLPCGAQFASVLRSCIEPLRTTYCWSLRTAVNTIGELGGCSQRQSHSVSRLSG